MVGPPVLLFAHASHTPSPVAHVVLALGVLLVCARLAGELAFRLGQPQVLGELIAGMALASIPGTEFFHRVALDTTIDVLGGLGAIVLLFEAGLALDVREVLRVGIAAGRVAILGTVVTFAFGFGAATLLLPSARGPVRAYLAAALTATSVGISARVLKDIGQTRSTEARTVLGAAVLDDVLGLLVLSLATGFFSGDGAERPSAGGLAILTLKTVAFLGGSLFLGQLLAPRLFALAARIRSAGTLVVVGLAFCFFLAWAADFIGLAPIIGAFTAGLVLEEGHWRAFVERGERGLDQEIEPISAFLVPLFFALLGLRTDLRVFGDAGALALTLGLTVAAVLGKLSAGLGASRGTNRLAVSFGMMPRGEVSLIFASLGLTLGGATPVLDHKAYSAIIVMVALTTLLTPFGLERSFARRRRKAPLKQPAAGA